MNEYFRERDAPTGRYVTPEQVEAICRVLRWAQDIWPQVKAEAAEMGEAGWAPDLDAALEAAFATLAPLLDETERPS